MKLLFILPEFYPSQGGGIITFYQNLIPALQPYCTRIKVMIGSGYVQDNYESVWNGIEIEYLQPEIYHRHLKQFNRFDFIPQFKKNLAAAWAMFEQVRSGEGFDAVECTDFGAGYLPWVIRQTIPVTTRLHGSTGQITHIDPMPGENLTGDFFRQMELLTLPFNESLQTHSRSNQLFWKNYLQKKVELQYPVFTVARATEILPLSERSPHGLVTGRLQFWKGPITLAEALQQDDAGLKVHWYGRDMPYLASGTSMSGYLEENFKSIWQNSMRYQPRISSEEVLKLQGKLKYGLIPSTWDMFNMSCLEFMAAGTPVVCSDNAGASDLIRNGINGFTFKAGDAADLLGKLRLMDDLSTAAYLKVCSAARRTIQEELAPEILAPSYIASYKKAIGNFLHKAPGDFLSSCYQPDFQKQDIADLLDQQPLSKLLPYLKNRLLKKIRTK